MRKYKLSLKEGFHFVNDKRVIWPKKKIMKKLLEFQKTQNLNMSTEKMDSEYEELVEFLSDQKMKMASREYK